MMNSADSMQGYRRRFLVAAGAVLLGVVGCSESIAGPEDDPSTAVFTVDASTDTVYVSLGGGASMRQVADYAASTAWDLGFFSTLVLVNGTGIGPGGVTVHCVCQNSGATSDQIKNMSEAGELADFTAVTAAQIPSSPAAWSATTFTTSAWYLYDTTQHVIFPNFNVYLLKRGEDVYKLQIVSYYGAAGEPRQVKFRYELLTD